MESMVLYPTPAIGHLIAMVELGKLILTSKPSLSIHILIATPPYNADDTAAYIAGVSTTTPSITFHHLPPISLPPELSTASPHHETLTFEVIRLNKPIVSQALLSISQNNTIHAFIMDLFCGSTLTVSADLNIPTYFFYTSGAASLSSFLYLPTLHETIPKSFKDLNNTLLHFPATPPIPSLDMPKPLLDRHDKAYQYFLESSANLPKSDGILVNTFESLEPRALKAVREGLCVPHAPTPPIYCIGPLITTKEQEGSNSECLKWLDLQPRHSVVFLCFGSLGLFSKEQLKEIAVGLERSGQRFLWVVRNPPPPQQKNQSVAISESLEIELDSLLPPGFLDRTKDRGLVVKNWAPQVEVLSHDSVGGFVTHCGWNSVLESICAGVPMVAWPLYAEQRFNRVVLVEEIQIALPMNESDDGFVSASEVEKRVTELMASSESGGSLWKPALALKDEARAALSDGGSSRVALTKLTELWEGR
ncbi:UDP-glycosyltransferase 88A1 [Morus notabilis]|uniref:Glycosyltransferase n=1 Tax=Morus notabilis TaxID=981085 RepID=W9RDV1_9ROSA|nr:UDP-glycosyltransferase 88A1 [Morus notabilis]EXB84476.1 UDP-glycosyltransferase 88A1 [Morus notabilis]